ncbi:hypothetical protein GON01_10280 [Sphingomonas sp. MAH-20]|uniref:Uncharacterized protein n=1 Tax=Sphingomonas horti TaxID=2682842 RepID=A0A6I4J1U5_9SPHN|nr:MULTISPECIES: hypothetical protein [Sphingomonas]MBA2919437.1 hypothetical protein [Sphingomonas sp. CGMCC 1.13658]MVO78317.1 hypothetical protein [Sphingomonas horti]
MTRLFLLVPLMLAGCASAGVGPSLAKRPIEDRDLSEPVRQVAPPAPADASLKAQIDGLVARARAGQSGFAALLPKAESAASGAGADGSESWVVAQELLSALESERAPSTTALAELDALIAERVKTGSEAGLTELQAADAEVGAIVEAQQRDLDRIRARIVR